MSATVRIGFHPLNDCALLAVAQECGMFAAEGVAVTLSREPSWSNIRDKLAYGMLEAAHCLAPMPIASALGLGPTGVTKLIAPMALGLGGNSVVAAHALAEELGETRGPAQAGAAIARVVRERAVSGRPPLVFGAPFLFSAHVYVLRQWLADSGVDPQRDVRLVVAPPVRMASMAKKGVVDAFCVGAPWGQVTVLEGAGRLLFSDGDYWPHKPEKVLAVGADFAGAAPETLQALLRALLRASLWADQAVNRRQLAQILASPAYTGAPASMIEAAFSGPLSTGHIFAGDHATYPWPQHGQWFARQMQRWGEAPASAAAAAESVYRPDLWRVAATVVGLPAPERGAQPPEYAGSPSPR